MEVTPPPSMLVDPAIEPRQGAVGASLDSVEQPASSELGSAAPVLGEQVNLHALDVEGALKILIAEVREALTLVANSPLQPTVPQSLMPEDNLPEPPLLDSPLPPEAIAAPMDSVPEGIVPWTSSNDVLLAEAALTNATVRVIYTALGVPPVQLGPATAPFTVIQMMLQRLPAEESQRPAEWLNTATQVEGLVRTAMDKAVDAVTVWRDVPPTAVAVVIDARTLVLAALDEDSPNPLWLMPEMMCILPRMQRYWRLRRRLRRSLDQEEAIRSGDREDAEQTFP
jgi:hypothetical protein